MREGLVSVIIPAYNCERFISETIESVIAQTYPDWEMVIIDDKSTDRTEEIIESYARKDGRIRFYRNESNIGAAETRNKGMELAEGEFMAFLDSDDLWAPKKLEKQIDFMRKNDHAFTCTSYEHISEEGEKTGRVFSPRQKANYRQVVLYNSVGNLTVVYNVKKLGKFTAPNVFAREDYGLWLSILKKEDYIWGLPEVLAYYRIRKASCSRNKFRMVKYQWILLHDVERLGFFRSCLNILYTGLLKVLFIK